jgi:hypothetical protein
MILTIPELPDIDRKLFNILLAPTASSPMWRCPYRVHGLVGAAAAAPTRPLDTDVTCLHGLRPRKLRATGQRRIRQNRKTVNEYAYDERTPKVA